MGFMKECACARSLICAIAVGRKKTSSRKKKRTMAGKVVGASLICTLAICQYLMLKGFVLPVFCLPAFSAAAAAAAAGGGGVVLVELQRMWVRC